MFEGVSEAKFRYPQIVPVSAGKRIFLEYRKDLALETFEVKHSVPSMGGTLYFYKRKLKDEFLGKTPAELIELRKQKVEITREVYEPLVSFTGDYLGESLLEHKDVFKSKVLITECTFLDPGEEQMAHQKGHTHIADIVRALNKLDSDVKCDMIILNHFSMKYAEKHIRERIAKEIPAQSSDKVVALI